MDSVPPVPPVPPTTPDVQIVPPAPHQPKLPFNLKAVLPVIAMVAALPFLAKSVFIRQLMGSRAAYPNTYCVATFGCPTPAPTTPNCPSTYGCNPPTPTARQTTTVTPAPPTPTTRIVPTNTPRITPIVTSVQLPTSTPVIVPSPTPAVNSAPKISTPGLQGYILTVGKSFSTSITGRDANPTDILTMTAQGLPPGIKLGPCAKPFGTSVNQLTCTIQGTPTTTGLFRTTITLSDNRGGTARAVLYFLSTRFFRGQGSAQIPSLPIN